MQVHTKLLLLTGLVSLFACTKFAPAPDASTDAHDAASTGSGGAADAAPDTASAPDVNSTPDATDAASDGAPALALGHACIADRDCASGHCATGVCCDQACAGPCAQCSSAGACQMPADDPVCGTIVCPADTACRDFDSSVPNRCKALGQCKAAADCAYVDRANGTFCGYYDVTLLRAQFCDGMGSCKGPTVLCGNGGECRVNPGLCCSGTTCTTDANCASSGLNAYCDEAADCAMGQVCCAFFPVGGAVAYCATSCVSSGSTEAIQVCKLGSGECLTGSCVSSGRAGSPYFWCQ